ncbi:HD domain-containing protein [bacterium]|nr:HD domain-containing protein [bacterium]
MSKEIRVPLYGFVDFSDLELELIDTDWMRRLKRIRQLALTDEVYPGAVHTRFEHSLGVVHVVSEMFRSIFKERKKNRDFLNQVYGYEITDEKIERWYVILRLAALLHDIGHAPFSHASEELFPINSATGKPYTHENYTAAIIRGPLKRLIDGKVEVFGEVDSSITADLIANFFDKPSKLGKLKVWHPLISGQLDADRSDYLLRDSYHLYVKYGWYDLDRIIETISLARDPATAPEMGGEDIPGDVVVAIEEGGRQTAEGLVIARYMMFLQVYFHHARRSFDHHLCEALKALLPTKKYPDPDCLSEYFELDDTNIWQLMLARRDNPDAMAIIERKHDRFYAETVKIPNDDKDYERELKQIRAKRKSVGNCHKWEDESVKSWYSFNLDDNPIYIVNPLDENREAEDLRLCSPVVEKLSAARFWRYYTDYKHRDEVKELLKGEV